MGTHGTRGTQFFVPVKSTSWKASFRHAGGGQGRRKQSFGGALAAVKSEGVHHQLSCGVAHPNQGATDPTGVPLMRLPPGLGSKPDLAELPPVAQPVCRRVLEIALPGGLLVNRKLGRRVRRQAFSEPVPPLHQVPGGGPVSRRQPLLRFPTFLAQVRTRLTKLRRLLSRKPHDAGGREVDEQAGRADGRWPSYDKSFNRNQNYFWNHHDPNRLPRR